MGYCKTSIINPSTSSGRRPITHHLSFDKLRRTTHHPSFDKLRRTTHHPSSIIHHPSPIIPSSIIHHPSPLECSSRLLLSFNCFEKCFEISFSKTLRSFALNDFEKHRWTIKNGFGEKFEVDILRHRDRLECRDREVGQGLHQFFLRGLKRFRNK
jgi:hypothetical protein